MESIAIFILAGGKGSRMGMDMPKVLAETGDGSLIHHVLRTAAGLDPESIVIVTGHGREEVERTVVQGAESHPYDAGKIKFVYQPEQKGTGDAARYALDALPDFVGTILILCGDVPLVEAQTLRALIGKHDTDKATVSLISVRTERPASYGRVIRAAADAEGRRAVEKIVEAKDATEEELLCNEINSGIYAVDSAFLAPALSELKSDNSQGEFYLTDIVARAVSEGQNVSALLIDDIEEVQGVNTPNDLTAVLSALKRRRVEQLLSLGVIIDDPESTFVDPGVAIAPGARLGPNVQLLGSTRVGARAYIEGSAWLKDTTIGEGTHIKFGVRAENAVIGHDCTVGPFAQLRPGTVLEESVHIGNFVETKNAVLDKGAKANHLSYLGDCEVGEEVNVGAGTITCNYDGYSKHRTVIERGASIGSNSSLVAPVTIGEDAYIGAGSVISKNIEKDALALTRSELKVVPGWSKRRKEKRKKS